jgi:hypothetical protein
MNDELELGTEELEEEPVVEETPVAPPVIQPTIDPNELAKALRASFQQPAVVEDPIEALYREAAENWYSDPTRAQQLQRQAARMESDQRMQSYQQEIAETLRPLREDSLLNSVAGDADVEVKQALRGFLQGMDSRTLAGLQNDPKVMQLLGYAAKGMQAERPSRPKAPMSHANSQPFNANNVNQMDKAWIMKNFAVGEKDAIDIMRAAREDN